MEKSWLELVVPRTFVFLLKENYLQFQDLFKGTIFQFLQIFKWSNVLHPLYPYSVFYHFKVFVPMSINYTETNKKSSFDSNVV